MRLAGIFGSIAVFCSQDTMNGLAFMSHLFLRANNALSRGSNKDKLRET